MTKITVNKFLYGKGIVPNVETMADAMNTVCYKNQKVLVVGDCKTGKTEFAVLSVVRAANRGEKVLFIYDDSTRCIYNRIKNAGYVGNGNIVLCPASAFVKEDGAINHTLSEIITGGYDLVVCDTIDDKFMVEFYDFAKYYDKSVIVTKAHYDGWLYRTYRHTHLFGEIITMIR